VLSKRRNAMMLPILRRGVSAAALAGVVALGLVACGAQQATTQTPSTPDRSPAASPSTSPSTSPGTGNEEPMAVTITLRRTGGIAGFMDDLTVEPDGTATLKSRGKDPITCTVKPTVRSKLEAAATATANEPAPRSESKTKKDLKTSTPDLLHLVLVVGDEEVRFSDLGPGAKAYRELFTLMSNVMSSAAAIQSGRPTGPDSACTA
jgi:hypothetical protein